MLREAREEACVTVSEDGREPELKHVSGKLAKDPGYIVFP
jgi:hypothetical protein